MGDDVSAMKRSALAAILALTLATPTLAAKPGANLSLSDPAPQHGDTLTVYATDIQRAGRDPYVLIYVTCDANTDGQLDYIAGGRAYLTDTAAETVTLTGTGWPEGPATCDAFIGSTYDGTKFHELARLTFTVVG